MSRQVNTFMSTRKPKSLKNVSWRNVRAGRRSRRSGVVIVYVAGAIVVLLGVSALAVDMGHLYVRRAAAQNAADAAAMAGAAVLANAVEGVAATPANATAAAKRYARDNGYDTDKGAILTEQINPPDEDGVYHTTRYKVTLSRPETWFFGGIAVRQSYSQVAASATAQWTPGLVTPSSIPVGGSGRYGKSGSAVNLSMFGPYALYNNGDPYSPRFNQAGNGPNPSYAPEGVDFDVDLSSFTGTDLQIEIYDPDCYNNGGTDALQDVRVDEIRAGHAGGTSQITTTKYSLYNDNGTPGNTADDVLVDSRSFGNDATTDMKWNSVFNVPTSQLQAGQKLRLNVQTTDGSSENGFDLRAGPPHAQMTDEEWSQAYGAMVPLSAPGRMPMNFNRNGEVLIDLGMVPQGADNVYVRKFDTDIGGRNIVYHCSTLSQTFSGVTSGNGEWVTDTIPLPPDYNGGFWTASYMASAQDTSAWEMTYAGPNIVSRTVTKPTLTLIR
jgi:Flp pilus assembly protein TadG